MMIPNRNKVAAWSLCDVIQQPTGPLLPLACYHNNNSSIEVLEQLCGHYKLLRGLCFFTLASNWRPL